MNENDNVALQVRTLDMIKMAAGTEAMRVASQMIQAAVGQNMLPKANYNVAVNVEIERKSILAVAPAARQ